MSALRRLRKSKTGLSMFSSGTMLGGPQASGKTREIIGLDAVGGEEVRGLLELHGVHLYADERPSTGAGLLSQTRPSGKLRHSHPCQRFALRFAQRYPLPRRCGLIFEYEELTT
jgi:hypothetical protein